MSPVDPKISRYIEEANRIKSGETRAAEREAEKLKPKLHHSINLESHRAYRAMYPYRPTYTWLFTFFVAAGIYGLSWLGEYFPYDRPVSLVVMIALTLWGILQAVIMPTVWFAMYRGWRSRLPFTLIGWEECLSDSRLLNRKNWRNVTITISSPVTTPELTTAIEATLMFFCRKAWKNFYAADSGAASRSAWTSSGFSATGSANHEAFGLIGELCRGPLSRIAKMHSAKMTVTLTPTTDYYFVKPAWMGIR